MALLRKECCDETTWVSCTLCRAQQQSEATLQRAASRRVEWPKPPSHPTVYDEPTSTTSLDDAFATVLQYMNSTTRQCKRYYRGSEEDSCGDAQHCNRFHTPRYTHASKTGNPLSTAESIHVVAPPGSYSVTAAAGSRDNTQTQQTHVVRLDQGQEVNLNFCL